MIIPYLIGIAMVVVGIASDLLPRRSGALVATLPWLGLIVFVLSPGFETNNSIVTLSLIPAFCGFLAGQSIPALVRLLRERRTTSSESTQTP